MEDEVILGFNGGHEGSVALVINGKLMAAVAKERITREKKDEQGNDRELVNFLLGLFDLKISDVNYITFCDNFLWGSTYIEFYKKGYKCGTLYSQDLTDSYNEIEARVEGETIPAFHIHHQLSHCAYAFYTSDFEKAACLSVDSSYGEPHAYSLIALGEGDRVHKLKVPDIRVGNLYNYAGTRIGFGKSLHKAGTIMGLSSYGKPSKDALENWKEMTRLNYKEFWYRLSGVENGEVIKNPESKFNKVKNIAASLQYIFERSLLDEVEKVYEDTKEFHEGNLCLSGGSFLNSSVNTLIKEKSSFSNISISPASGDDGLAAGSALYLSHNILGVKRAEYKNSEIAYLGASYEIPDIGEPYDEEKVAKMLSEDKIIAWYQGRSEFGPRALGNRSLLANPSYVNTKHLLNAKIKEREWFRPFAPSVLKEETKDWFDFERESPFMLFNAKVKKSKSIPAVTHIDNTSRIQTVRKEDNPRFYNLIKKFKEITGMPMVLNTSLNRGGEPIIETPEEALLFLNDTDVDALVLEDRFIRKEDLPKAVKQEYIKKKYTTTG